MERAILPCMENILPYIHLKIIWNDDDIWLKSAPLHIFALCLSSYEADDVKLNACVFHWPEKILKELEKSKVQLANTRQKTEDYIEDR